jgi:hypothetical protein
VIELVSGALVFAYLVAGLHFLRFWRRTRDRLFRYFAIAFWLFGVNQAVVSIPSLRDVTAGWEYVLRVLGFILILVAIAQKNVTRERD